MIMKWLTVFQRAFSVLTELPEVPPHRSNRFDLGVCRGCRGLRSVSSLRCTLCGSTRPVAADP